MMASACSTATDTTQAANSEEVSVTTTEATTSEATTSDAGDVDAETTTSAPQAAGESAVRVSEGLVSIYGFDEVEGSQVGDSVGDIDLTISDPDAVTWLDGALRIDTPTTIGSSTPPTAMIDAATTTGELSVEAWIETDNLDQSGPARIVSISGDTQNRNFTVGQGVHNSDGNFLDVRLRSTDTSDNGEPSLASPDGILTTRLTHIVATRSADGTTRLYFDGVLQSTGAAGGDLSNWDDSYRLLIGNEATGDRPWVGTLHMVALYGRALTDAEVAQNFNAGHSAA